MALGTRTFNRAGAILAAAICVLIVGTGRKTWASAGCTAVNAGGFNETIDFGPATTIAGFSVGDTINFSINTDAFGGSWTLQSGNGTTVGSFSTSGTGTQAESYTVTGANQDTTLSQTILGGGGEPTTVTATCTAGASNTDSNKIRALQVAASTLVAETSGAAITGAVDGAIGDAFANGGNPITVGPNRLTLNFAAEPGSEVARGADHAFSALGYAANGMPTKAPPPLPVVQPDWSLWADVHGTGWDHNNTDGTLNGEQLNVTAGIGRKLSSDFLVGLIGGYENFKYTSAALDGRFRGDGGTIGAYAAWRFAPGLRWDATLARSGIDYDATAGTASGAFQGSRWLVSTGLTGLYRWAALIFEPSAKVFALWEHQGAWTDSLGTLQAARDFSSGRVATGGRVLAPWRVGPDMTLAPYLGLYADYRFSTDNALPAGQPIVGIGDGWSGRVTGGVTVTRLRGGTLTLNGEYGGIGADYHVWTANAQIHWPW